MKFFFKDKHLHADGKWPKRLKNVLLNSSRKWACIIEYLESHHESIPDDRAGRTCNLCHVFGGDGKCLDCPVYPYTHGEGRCHFTPYQEYFAAMKVGNHNDALHAAKAEWYFLKMLYELQETQNGV